ncbi:MAG: trypsin-like peptidase domain-containing protein [Oscillospiraceae bacterium]|nr:trypsin-like peptidase domain-containing protein [Oscillospiraceae bacterium]
MDNNFDKKKRLSGEWLCAIISVLAAMFVVSIVLMGAIAVTNSKIKDNRILQNSTITKVQNDNSNDTDNAADNIIIELPRAEKPVLDNEMYQNKETGLLTTIGVAEIILPSQVKIEVYGDMPYTPMAYGSGIILTEDGYILTNAHVVDGAEQIAVVFYDGSEAAANVIGFDKKSDLAVIKVDRDDLSPAELGTSSSLVIGEEIAVAGAGGGWENTVTYGHVTGLNRSIDTDYMSSTTVHCVQIDAAANPGNSGCAVVNMYGQVVGIVVVRDDKYENIVFSIEIDDAVPIIEELIAYGYVTSRAQVGITYVPIGDASASAYGIMSGLCVMGIDPACDAVNADLMLYDIITEINGKRVFGSEEIVEVLSGKKPGDVITLTVCRKNITGDVSLFETQVKLSPDTKSVSGYAVPDTEDGTKDDYNDE